MNNQYKDRKKGDWLPYLKNPVVISIIITMLLLPFLKPLLTHIPDLPDVIAEIPEFKLLDENGHSYGKENLIGNVHVVGFIFTRCKGVCPFTVEAMKNLSTKYDEVKLPIRLLLVTVDPEYDTPIILKNYAKERNIDLNRWNLLTGDRTPIIDLIEGGFKLFAGDKIQNHKKIIDISHSSKLALIDGKGFLRGYFDTTKDGIDEVFHRSQHVLFSMSKTKI